VIYFYNKTTKTYKNAGNATRAQILLKAYIFIGSVLILEKQSEVLLHGHNKATTAYVTLLNKLSTDYSRFCLFLLRD
jgi:hypothetical protein